MSKRVKNLVETEYRQRYDGVEGGLVVSLSGLGAVDTVQVRQRLRDRQVELHVVKNSLARRALQETPLAPLGNVLEGPSALVTGGESVGDAAKLLVALATEFKAIELKLGLIEGESEVMPVADIAKLPSRLELLGQLAGAIASAGGKIAGCAAGPAGRLAGCLKAIADRADPEGEAVAA